MTQWLSDDGAQGDGIFISTSGDELLARISGHQMVGLGFGV